jgi:tRNA uridine 5-carboxymethylaminomethyl modification enzyme
MFCYPEEYDVIVVGGGHAGIEASLAAARMGCKTMLLTANPDTIGQMSCNPAIGGQAKGQLAREIDALGGEMGRCTDFTGIHFRMLNTRKGPAVQAPRAQCDKRAYQLRMKHVCEQQMGLDIRLGSATRLLVTGSVCGGVESDLGIRYRGKCTVLTTGTFLRGLMHVGSNQRPGGRSGESPALGLTESLRQVGLETGRLKTGTPPRLHRRSIDFSKTIPQPSDSEVPSFSFWHHSLFHVEQSSSSGGNGGVLGSLLAKRGPQHCFITRTTSETSRVIRSNLHKSPMYSGVIEGVGPRYCPSIEDKIVRFADKETHQIFLEPEGLDTEEVYVNGFSTCLPFDVQYELVRTIVGCENAEIIRPAYAVEYDFVNPTQLSATLETKVCSRLFLAGQINGTSGYEEAAAQGIVAGINAALLVRGEGDLVIGRDQGYIGVLIDDLITKGTTEPYRMFTSRAEHRLLLRHSNADLRLSPIGYRVGLLPEHCHERVRQKQRLIDEELNRLQAVCSEGRPLSQILRRPEVRYQDLPNKNAHLPVEVADQVEIAVKYAGYIERQEMEAKRMLSLESKRIPAEFDFSGVPNLRTEARLKLTAQKPINLGQASRIPGVTPADISVLLVWLRRGGDLNRKG